MSRDIFLITFWAGFFTLAVGPVGAAGPGQPADDADSRYEYVELLDHSRYFGLIESEDDQWLTLIRIASRPGQQMHLVIQPFDRSQVSSLQRLDPDKRAELEQRIAEFRNPRHHWGAVKLELSNT